MNTKQLPITFIVDTEQFIAIPDNARQRPTEDRVAKATKKGGHLSVPHQLHNFAAIAMIADRDQVTADMIGDPSVPQWKLDGHTRSYLWESGRLEMPPQIMVVVTAVNDEETAKEFYRAFDSTKAAETTNEKVYGAMSDAFGRKPMSNIYKAAGVKTGIEIAFNNGSNMVDDKLYSLKATDPLAINAMKKIDGCEEITKDNFKAYSYAAMFLSVLRDGDKALQFWGKFNQGVGIQDESGMCAVKNALECFREINTYAQTSYVGTSPRYIVQGQGRDVHSYYMPYFLEFYHQWSQDPNARYRPKHVGGFYQRQRTKFTIEKFLGKPYKEYSQRRMIFDGEV